MKLGKYLQILEECRSRFLGGIQNEPIKIGCSVSVGLSLCKMLSNLGVTVSGKTKTIRSTSMTVEEV